MKKQILRLSIAVGLIITSSGAVIYHDGYENMKNIAIKQDEKIQEKSSKIAKLESDVAKKDSKIKSQNKVIDDSKKEIDSKNKEIEKLREEIRNFKRSKERSDAKRQNQSKPLTSRGGSKDYRQINVLATGYIAMCDTGCTGITATGVDVRSYPSNRIIAVDPSIIPLHSKVKIETSNGESFFAVAEDTGGAIKGYRIDILKSTYSEASNFGKQSATVTILE